MNVNESERIDECLDDGEIFTRGGVGMLYCKRRLYQPSVTEMNAVKIAQTKNRRRWRRDLLHAFQVYNGDQILLYSQIIFDQFLIQYNGELFITCNFAGHVAHNFGNCHVQISYAGFPGIFFNDKINNLIRDFAFKM